MKVEQIKCNGLGYSYPANLVKPTILTAINIFKMRFSEDDILKILEKEKRELDLYAGSRFNNSETVCDRILTALTAVATEEYLKKSVSEINENDITLLEMSILSFVDSLSGSEMDKIILDGLLDCASTDYWYKYEKQWD